MGYILPIQHDTYTQYANRSVPVQSHYSHILPTAAIQLTNKYMEEETKQNHQRFVDVLEQKMQTVKPTKFTSSFTGKGQLFNEYV
jgi:hypothetical protein